MSEPKKWLEGMGEISGFGGGYEECCRRMLLKGVAWLDAHPHSNPFVTAPEGVFGLATARNIDAEALESAFTKDEPDITGAMHHAVFGHLMFIKKHGWDAYVAEMRKRPADEKPEKTS